MADNAIQIPHLKQNALVNVKMGAAFISKLQEMFKFLTEGHEDELKALQEKAPNYENITPWESSVITTTTLLKEIAQEAERTGQLEYKPVDSFIPNSQG